MNTSGTFVGILILSSIEQELNEKNSTIAMMTIIAKKILSDFIVISSPSIVFFVDALWKDLCQPLWLHHTSPLSFVDYHSFF